MCKDFESIDHTADIKIRVYGETLQQLFCNAVAAMFQVINPHIPGCKRVNDRIVCDTLPIDRHVIVEAPNIELLLVDFLSEALYLSDVHNEVYLDATIEALTQQSIKAMLHGIKIAGFEEVEIKAVTYHELVVKQVDHVWHADIIFDI